MCWTISHKHIDRELCMGPESLTNVSKGDCLCHPEKQKFFSSHFLYTWYIFDFYDLLCFNFYKLLGASRNLNPFKRNPQPAYSPQWPKWTVIKHLNRTAPVFAPQNRHSHSLLILTSQVTIPHPVEEKEGDRSENSISNKSRKAKLMRKEVKARIVCFCISAKLLNVVIQSREVESLQSRNPHLLAILAGSHANRTTSRNANSASEWPHWERLSRWSPLWRLGEEVGRKAQLDAQMQLKVE